ncbi:MAG: hypothetical protein V4440_12065 [Pseudomonadota bacterium]
MARTHLDSTMQLTNLLELGKDYCSDHLGRFFQNKYSQVAPAANKFKIPAKLATKSEQDCFAICVMMNNHIVDLKYFSDIFQDLDNNTHLESLSSKQNSEKFSTFINDQRLLSVIKRFKKVNDEIVIGRCRGREFTPIH